MSVDGAGGCFGRDDYTCKECSRLEQENTTLKEGLKLCLPLAEQMFPKEIPEGLGPMFYHTLSYTSDLEISNQIQELKKLL